jgi:hypothetical protein
MKTEPALLQKTAWVIGGGRFGRRAVEALRASDPNGNILVVDKEPLRNLPSDIEIICADGIDWFTEHFVPDACVDKIIPALPLHLAADWIKKKLANEHHAIRSEEILDEHLYHFPHPMRISASRIVMSHADFICPPNCSEPNDICTYTQKRRPISLHHILEIIQMRNFVPLIVQSRQFASGVGGYFPEDLWYLFEHTQRIPGTPLLIGTACKCHGIVDGFSHTMP